MTSTRLLAVFSFLIAFVSQAQAPNARVEAAFQKFWSAGSPEQAERFAEDVVNSGVPFDEAYRRLKAGRTFSAQKTGIVKLSRKARDGAEYFYAVNVPENYDPAKR